MIPEERIAELEAQLAEYEVPESDGYEWDEDGLTDEERTLRETEARADALEAENAQISADLAAWRKEKATDARARYLLPAFEAAGSDRVGAMLYVLTHPEETKDPHPRHILALLDRNWRA